jgi:large subunit ribosomal protein L23
MSLLSFAKKIVGTKKDVSRAQKKPSSTAKKTEERTFDAHWVLRVGLTPLTTEKSVAAQEHNVVAFRVRSQATKGQIALAIREKYGVSPLVIRTVTMHPKGRRRGYTSGTTSRWKKAYVTVQDAQSLHVAP